MVREIKDFEAEVVRSKVSFVVDFWAEWCGPCKMLGPVFEKMAQDKVYEKKIEFGKVNVDEQSELAQQIGVLNIPCIVFFKQGEEQGRMVGFAGEAALREKLESWISEGEKQ